MIGDSMGGDLIAYGVGAGGLLFAVGQMAWSRFFGEDRNRAELYQQLSDRVKAQEERMANYEQQLDTERLARMNAEYKVRALEYYVRLLKAELMRHGIEVPPSHFDPLDPPPEADPMS